MRNVELLDCTLRDGGYINDWNFGYDTLTSVFERLVSSGVEVIEVGFLDKRRNFDKNRSIMPDTESVEKIYGKIDKGHAMVVGMIDYGTCPIDCLQPCCQSFLDGIRVIFKKHLMHEALEYCRQVKALGYKVFTQAVSITSYSDEELVELIGLVNEIQPHAVSMVDTYGLLHQDNLLHIFEIMDKHLLPKVCLGYHAHNNFQLGYANCIEVLNKRTSRTVFVDGTLYGMGKSAGNTPLELLGMYLNEHFEKTYDVSQMLEAIETDIMEIYNKIPWGYNLFYFIASSNKCHPNYVSYLLNKGTLSIKSVNEILRSIDEEKKLLYSQKHIEDLYLHYQTHECNDIRALEELGTALKGKKILLIGPGKSTTESSTLITRYISENKPVVIPINFIPKQFAPDYLFVSNAKRYTQIMAELMEPESNRIKVIATSNVTKAKGVFSYVLNYSTLIDPETDIPDNSLVMLLRMLRKVGVVDVALAGFDGYSASDMNYFNTNMEYSFAKEKAEYLNGYIAGFLLSVANELQVAFVTKSKYQDLI